MADNIISSQATIQDGVTLTAPVNIVGGVEIYSGSSVGSYTYINKGSVVYGDVHIGKFCSIGRNCQIGLHQHPTDWLSTHPFSFSSAQFKSDAVYCSLRQEKWSFSKETKIGSDVWIGTGSLIVSGIVIGDGAIIAAGSIITKDVQPYTIVGGNPAHQIRSRFTSEQIAKLLKISWWNMELELLRDLPHKDIDKCITILEERLDHFKNKDHL